MRVPDSFALAHAAISWQPTATAAGSSPPRWQPTDTYKDSEELSKQLHPPSPQPCGVLPGIPRGVFPFPLPPPSQGTSATSVRGVIAGENDSMSNTQPSWHHCEPRDHPTIVIPRLQISDLTLYPFWFSSGLILSGCEQRQRQLRQGRPQRDAHADLRGVFHGGRPGPLSPCHQLAPWVVMGPDLVLHPCR